MELPIKSWISIQLSLFSNMILIIFDLEIVWPSFRFNSFLSIPHLTHSKSVFRAPYYRIQKVKKRKKKHGYMAWNSSNSKNNYTLKGWNLHDEYLTLTTGCCTQSFAGTDWLWTALLNLNWEVKFGQKAFFLSCDSQLFGIIWWPSLNWTMCHILYWIYLILLNTEKGQYLPFKSKIIIGTYASFMKINPNRSDLCKRY